MADVLAAIKQLNLRGGPMAALRSQSVTPKGTLVLNASGKAAFSGATTFKLKQDKLSASLAITDATIKNTKSLKDVVATVDWAANKSVAVNTKYELGSRKYTVGATLDQKLAGKATTLKLSYSNKDKLVAGEATAALAKGVKANTTFNQKRVLATKLTLTKGDYTIEPSYNLVRAAAAVSATKKLGGKDTLKISYDLKSQAAAAEYAHKPFKLTLGGSVSQGLTFSKPTLSAVYENTISF